MVAKHPKPIRSGHAKLGLEREKSIKDQAKLKTKKAKKAEKAPKRTKA